MTPPDTASQTLPLPGRRPARNADSRPRTHGLVAERLQARRRRTTAIRRRVVGIAAALFLAVSGGIFVQLVTGNDPALVSAAAKTTAVASSTPSSGSTSSGATTSSGSSNSGSSSSGAPSAVTTGAS
jgi:hypothetical protein